MRYNYILSAALDSSVAIGIVAVFLALQLPKVGGVTMFFTSVNYFTQGGINLIWWGNTVWQNTADNLGLPFYTLAPNQTFGPAVVCNLLLGPSGTSHLFECLQGQFS